MPDEKDKSDVTPITDPKDYLRAKKMDLGAEAQRLALEADAKKMSMEAGWIGRLIGSAKNAPNNLAFLGLVLAFFVALIGLVVTLVRSDQQLEIWKYVTPIITLAMGYVFGLKSSEK